MPTTILGGSVPSYDTDTTGVEWQIPGKPVDCFVHLIHAYHDHESYYGLSNYSRLAVTNRSGVETPYSFFDDLLGTRVQCNSSEVYLQAQKILDSNMRKDFYAQANLAERPSHFARTAFQGQPYNSYGPDEAGSAGKHSFRTWEQRSTEVQNYINYEKYQQDTSFRAAIDSYIAAKQAWLANGKTSPMPWIAEDTGAADYRDDNWGCGWEMLGANKLGNSQVAFAEALMAQNGSFPQGLRVLDFTSDPNKANSAGYMADMNSKVTSAYKKFVQPALMASVGWTPDQIAAKTSGFVDIDGNRNPANAGRVSFNGAYYYPPQPDVFLGGRGSKPPLQGYRKKESITTRFPQQTVPDALHQAPAAGPQQAAAAYVPPAQIPAPQVQSAADRVLEAIINKEGLPVATNLSIANDINQPSKKVIKITFGTQHEAEIFARVFGNAPIAGNVVILGPLRAQTVFTALGVEKHGRNNPHPMFDALVYESNPTPNSGSNRARFFPSAGRNDYQGPNGRPDCPPPPPTPKGPQ